MAPAAAAAYLRGLGEECVAAARALAPLAGASKELASTLVDIEALGELALFHAEKIPAAEELALYYASGDASALARALAQLPRARPHWERLAAVTSGVYTERQVTGPIDSGHWKDKLGLVREDEQRLAVIAGDRQALRRARARLRLRRPARAGPELLAHPLDVRLPRGEGLRRRRRLRPLGRGPRLRVGVRRRDRVGGGAPGPLLRLAHGHGVPRLDGAAGLGEARSPIATSSRPTTWRVGRPLPSTARCPPAATK